MQRFTFTWVTASLVVGATACSVESPEPTGSVESPLWGVPVVMAKQPLVVAKACADDGDCGVHAFCDQPACGAGDALGICRLMPSSCPAGGDPVCGCDGDTYGNACQAAHAGVSVAHAGSCEAVCGGIAGIACGPDEYCSFPDGTCAWADHTGVCRPLGVVCSDAWEPVCGCDGQTYDNRCRAGQAGVSVDHAGPCEKICGGIVANSCDPGEYCHYPDDTCDWADVQGVCEPLPETCPDNWAPVCACDGKTYGNACDAATAGQSIAHEGHCKVVVPIVAGP